MSSNMQVFVRCRPLVKSELNVNVPVEVYPELNKILVRDTGTDKNSVKSFTYDKVFSPDASQAEIYSEIVAPLVQEVIEGFNCTIFAYGQTGTGKTFTIEGGRSPNLQQRSDDRLAGIIPRSMKHLFDELSRRSLKHYISVSFLELYNEEIFDLLSKSEDLVKLRMYENSSQKGSVIVQGLQIVTVKSMEEVYDILEKGCKKRRKGVTLLNKASSRSHTIFTVTVNSKESSTTLEKIKSGKLNLVDLAGSENIGRSGAINKTAREAGNINQSLLSLGRVITSLCEKAAHIPYRESKLTRLLQDSLGGQTKTAVIATISPSAINIDETLNTLEYALRAKSITNKPELNAQVTVNSIVQDYLEKIGSLRKAIYEAGKTNGVYASEESIRSWESSIVTKREEKFKLLSQVENLSEEDKALDVTILELKKRLKERENQLQNSKLKHDECKLQVKKAKDEHKLHEMVFDTLQPTYDCIHEKYHKTLEEIKMLELDLSKKKDAVEEALDEQRKIREALNERRYKQKLWNEKFRQDSENLMNDLRNMNDSVNLMTTECKNSITVLKNKFDSRKLDCEKAFQDFAQSMNGLQAIKNDFQKNIDVSLREEKDTKLNSIENFFNEYSSSRDNGTLEGLNQIISACESNLISLSNAANEWRKEAASQMEFRRKQMNEYKENMKFTLESTAENAKALLNKQKENMEKFNIIASESLNVESTSRKMIIDKFRNADQAISTLDICCGEAIENEVDKTNKAYSYQKNYLELGGEITENLLNCGENVGKNIDSMHTEAENHVPGFFSEKWEDLKTKEDSAFERYKNLTEELERLSKTNQINESVRRLLKDIEESNEQLAVSKSVQMMAETVMNRGNSFLTRMVTKQAKIDTSLVEYKKNLESFIESSKQLSKMTDSKMLDYQQYLRKDLLKRFPLNDTEETIKNEENTLGTNTVVSDRTLCLLNATSEETSPIQEFVPEIECSECFKHMNETLKTDENICMDIFKERTEESGFFNSSTSASFRSPIRRPRSQNSMTARKNLKFPNVEKLAQELLENFEDDVS